LRLTAENPLFRIGHTGDAVSDADRLTELALERQVWPTLRWAVERSSDVDADTRASAYLALAKTARDPSDVVALLSAAGDDSLPQLTRESAVLALGLLRRSDPALAFDAEVVDRVRRACLDAIDDETLPTRARAFGALALGLLGDQPSAKTSLADRDGRWIVRETWTRVHERPPSDEVPTALLVALSLQPPEAVPTGILDGLRTLAASGRLDGRRRGDGVRAQAALALAALSPDGAPGVLLALANGRSCGIQVQRAAVVALGSAAARLSPETRLEAAESLGALAARSGDPDARGLMVISAGRLLARDLQEGREDVATQATPALLSALDSGLVSLRPYAAIALGIGYRETTLRSPDAVHRLREDVVLRLRDAAASEGEDVSSRGAYCLALGLVKDEGATALLCGVAKEGGGPDVLRGDACAALGLLGRSTPLVLETLEKALRERSSEDVRRHAAVALGCLGDSRLVPVLLDDLESGGSDHVLAQVVLGLGAIGDAAAAPALTRLVRDRSATDLLRAIACAGLGLLSDPERVPSLSRLGTDSNYLNGTDALREALSLL
jgi:HEAT repeat protein